MAIMAGYFPLMLFPAALNFTAAAGRKDFDDWPPELE
jgi:hypothetical protein